MRMAESGDCDQLEVYKSQLKQIQDALLIATEEQKPDLKQIETDLLEIIEISQTPNISSTTPDDNNLDETSQNISKLEDELQSLEGVKCKVLFRYEWGGFGYHNAIILGSELSQDSSICVNVVFMHPTSKQMQPCPYYLDGTCKYSDDRCHYSHGYSVKLDEIQDYKEPDYSKITEGSVVLAKYKDGLWYRGNVENIIEEVEFSVKFPHCNDALLLNFHSIYPLDEEEEDNLAHFSAEEDGDLDFNSSRQEIQLFLADKSSFGQWEKHTKGIGSKLMAKMGYVHGTGLGKEGEGRTEPVEAMVFPPGRSLDRCMELREKAGSEDMLTVERRLERQKAQNEHRLRQLAKASEKSVSVFDFINSKLTKTTHQDSKDGASQSATKKADLSQISKEQLNVHSLQIGEDIRRAERDITRLKQSIQRQSDRGDLASVSQIRSRLADKEKELNTLRASDRTISNEQKQRKSSSKLTIF